VVGGGGLEIDLIRVREPPGRRERLERWRDRQVAVEEERRHESRMALLECPRYLCEVASDPALAVRAALDTLDVDEDAHGDAQAARCAVTRAMRGSPSSAGSASTVH
jgi:hypothetical protein